MSPGLLTLLATIGIALLWFYLTLRLLAKAGLGRKGKKGNGKGEGEGEGGNGEDDGQEGDEKSQARADAIRKAREEQARRDKEAREAAAANQRRQVTQAMQEDPLLRELLENLANINIGDLSDDDKAKQIIQRVSPHALQVLVVAGTQKEINMDLNTEVTREKSLFPTHDIEPMPMDGLEQMSQLLPEQIMMEDDPFYSAMATNELMVLQSFEVKVKRKTLHITFDLSPSMAEPMADGLTRHNWSRGITISLLLKAMRGEANYMMRGFDGHSYPMDTVDNADTAREMISKLLRTEADGSGTNIWGALSQAVSDVRAIKDKGQVADILLISDGQSNQGKTFGTEDLKALFGEDIRLHVLAIGIKAPVLKSVASSYREFL